MDGCLFTHLPPGPYLSKLRVLSADFGLIFNSAELLSHKVKAMKAQPKMLTVKAVIRVLLQSARFCAHLFLERSFVPRA